MTLPLLETQKKITTPKLDKLTRIKYQRPATELLGEAETAARLSFLTEQKLTTFNIIKPISRTVLKSELKTSLKPALKSALKTSLKTSLKPALKPALKTFLKPALKTALKPALKTALKPALKIALKPALKPTLKPTTTLFPPSPMIGEPPPPPPPFLFTMFPGPKKKKKKDEFGFGRQFKYQAGLREIMTGITARKAPKGAIAGLFTGEQLRPVVRGGI